MGTTTSQTIYVKYTAPNGSSSRPDIGYFTDPACTKVWKTGSIAFSDSVNYTFQPGNGTSPFGFVAITFVARDSKKAVVSQVGRSFQQGMSGTANFEETLFVSNVDVSSPQIAFTVTNNNDNKKNKDKGYLGLQTTIEDPGLQCLYTSVDPQVELKPQG